MGGILPWPVSCKDCLRPLTADLPPLWRISCAGVHPTEQDLLQWDSGACMSLPFECVASGGGWVVEHQDSLKLSTGVAGCGPSWECSPRSASTCVLSGANRHEVQSNLQMAFICAGPGGAQVRPSCEPWPSAAGAKPGAT